MGTSKQDTDLIARAKASGKYVGSLKKFGDEFEYYEMPDCSGIAIGTFGGNYPEKWSETLAWVLPKKELELVRESLKMVKKIRQTAKKKGTKVADNSRT